MKSFILGFIFCLFMASLWAKEPYAGYVYPSGMRQGTTVDVILGGDDVARATHAGISGDGVTAVIIPDPDLADTVLMRKKEGKRYRTMREVVTIRITAAPDAKPGLRDIFVVNSDGGTNKRFFEISQFSEETDTEPNYDVKNAQKLETLPVTVNGRLMPSDRDYYRFNAKKGEKILLELLAQTLIPYIPDAVPGWFQGNLEVFDGKGRSVAFSRDHQFRTDPVIFFDVPADDQYTVCVSDAIARGRDDFVYRLHIGPLPYLVSHYPLGGRSDLFNRPKPFPDIVTWGDVQKFELDGHAVRGLDQSGIYTNKLPFDLNENQNIPEYETCQLKQSVGIPSRVNGRILREGVSDSFVFRGKKGMNLAVSVMARRLGSPLDARMRIFTPDGKCLIDCDDTPDPSFGLVTHQADPDTQIVLPVDGDYLIELCDIQRKFGKGYSYRVKLDEVKPEVRLSVTPASARLCKNGTTNFFIRAERLNGHRDTIFFPGSDSPFKISRGLIPPNGKDVIITVTDSGAVPGKHELSLMGYVGGEKGKAVQVNPYIKQMQAFAFNHDVPLHSTDIYATGIVAPFTVFPLISIDSITVNEGIPLRIPVRIGRHGALITDSVYFHFRRGMRGAILGGVIPPGCDTGMMIFHANNFGKNIRQEMVIPQAFTVETHGNGERTWTRRVTISLPAICMNTIPKPLPPKKQLPPPKKKKKSP